MRAARLLLATFGAYLPAAALPALAGREDLPGGPQDAAALVVPFCLGFAVGFPAWGRAVDARGAAMVLRAGLLGSVLAGLAVAFAPGEAALVAARALQGLAAAAAPPAVQATLAARASEERTGRALSGMMVAVGVATLAGPVAAPALAAALGWPATAVLLGVALPLALLGARPPASETPPGARHRAREARAPYASRRGVLASWAVAALVLGGYWTVVTRDPGPVALAGLAGLPLVAVAARSADLRGPRRTMAATLAVGAAGFALPAGTALGLAAYWAYLPVVAAQAQRAAGPRARGRAAGGLYASMWAGAGAAGLLASLAPDPAIIRLGAAVCWGLAALLAARTFLGTAHSAAPCPAPRAAPRPSPR